MRKKEQHITYDESINGIIFIPKKGIFNRIRLAVRYSASNIEDSISFSDNKNFLVQVRVDDLKRLLNKYETEPES